MGEWEMNSETVSLRRDVVSSNRPWCGEVNEASTAAINSSTDSLYGP